uniref:Uncharacterized protein n=1 Tax=Pristionchus pacificus TaxID=54126 RepID=A0A2A6BPL2_PRIPA
TTTSMSPCRLRESRRAEEELFEKQQHEPQHLSIQTKTYHNRYRGLRGYSGNSSVRRTIHKDYQYIHFTTYQQTVLQVFT